jgi:arabinose-5-phosphate isomerase
VVDERGILAGFISDGDIRRHFLAHEKPFGFTAEQIMVREVTTIEPEARALDALHCFQSHPKKIGEMPVIEHDKPIGLVMLKDLVRIGLT